MQALFYKSRLIASYVAANLKVVAFVVEAGTNASTRKVVAAQEVKAGETVNWQSN